MKTFISILVLLFLTSCSVLCEEKEDIKKLLDDTIDNSFEYYR